MTDYMTDYMDDEGTKLLSNAIILQTYDDYKEAIEGKHIDSKQPQWIMDECEHFFKSEYFYELCDGNINADAIIKRAFEDVLEKYERQKKEIDKKIKKVKKKMETRLNNDNQLKDLKKEEKDT